MKPSVGNVINGTEDCNPAKHSSIPIHRLRCNWRRCWKEAKNEKGDQENQRNEVYRKSPVAKRELCLWKWMASQTFEEDATDREDIGRNQRRDGQGDDGIEGDTGT